MEKIWGIECDMQCRKPNIDTAVSATLQVNSALELVTVGDSLIAMLLND